MASPGVAADKISKVHMPTRGYFLFSPGTLFPVDLSSLKADPISGVKGAEPKTSQFIISEPPDEVSQGAC